ncbi:Na+/H+ antiporter subunit E [Desulfurispirillum indicum]|uniref:Cation antiporter n=1 Tax=Desulfurispirillum indicum (strain ATCC BAA-1389 / DSM 22839 / S5) TaxID=653733 RepID=E6W1P9_DESIS|nr:Na+/H+ antiporter subunit E [Desulfurispirillum indicum]ADU66598.1 cation antiporter [Desulfurispirillum indicum S5]UCZ55917.1 Na+/H+ antiporter subunit E [Desulfurispirillum indicum]
MPLFRSPRLRLLLYVYYLLFFCFLWAIVSGNQGWGIGLIAIAGAMVSVTLFPVPLLNFHPRKALGFFFYFVTNSLQSGISVARIAFHPALPLYPFWMRYRFHLPPGPARTLFVAIISLLPGTLSADMEEDFVRIHTVGADSTATRERLAKQLFDLEEHVAATFGEKLDADQQSIEQEYGL